MSSQRCVTLILFSSLVFPGEIADYNWLCLLFFYLFSLTLYHRWLKIVIPLQRLELQREHCRTTLWCHQGADRLPSVLQTFAVIYFKHLICLKGMGSKLRLSVLWLLLQEEIYLFLNHLSLIYSAISSCWHQFVPRSTFHLVSRYKTLGKYL